MAKENPKNDDRLTLPELLDHLQSLPNLPVDSPFRQRFVTSIDCMILFGCTETTFDKRYKTLVSGHACRGAWTLYTFEQVDVMIEAYKARSEEEARQREAEKVRASGTTRHNRDG